MIISIVFLAVSRSVAAVTQSPSLLRRLLTLGFARSTERNAVADGRDWRWDGTEQPVPGYVVLAIWRQRDAELRAELDRLRALRAASGLRGVKS